MIATPGLLLFLVVPFYLLLWLLSGIRRSGLYASKSSSPAISVIIPFRNEAQRIAPLLQSISALQLQAEDEILLIDDASTDGGIPSDIVLSQSVRVIHLTASSGSKKAALQAGILQSKNEWVLCSDADCWFDSDWLNAWRSRCDENINMLIGPVLTSGPTSSIASLFHHAESRCLQTFTIASAGHQSPLLSSGANLMFRKSVWEKLGGYSAHAHISSGDDVLLMQQFHAYAPERVKAVSGLGLLSNTLAASSWKEWFLQRRRWASKSGHVNSLSQKVHSILILIWIVLFPIGLFYIGPLYLLMLLPEMLLNYEVAKASGGQFAWYFWPVFRLFYPFILLLIPLSALFWPLTWKGRPLQKA